MLPISNGTATTPLRQSCDRCHKQKMRCTRSNTGACDRCLRKRAQCVYSSSLPKGRPSMYQSADDSSNARNNSGSIPAASTPPVRGYEGISSSSGAVAHEGRLPEITRTNDDALHKGTGAMALDLSRNDVKTRNTNTCIDRSLPSPDDHGSLNCVGSDVWPWVESLSWDDAEVSWLKQDSRPPMVPWNLSRNHDPQAGVAPPFPTPPWAPHPDDIIAGYRDQNSNNNNNASSKKDTTDATHQSQPHLSTLTQALAHLPSNELHGNSDPIFLIAELAQLSVRISSLRGFVQHGADPSNSTGGHQNRHHPIHSWNDGTSLIDDASFECITAWLARVSVRANLANAPPLPPVHDAQMSGSLLPQVFAASRDLLEILHFMQVNAGNGSNMSTSNSSLSTLSSIGREMQSKCVFSQAPSQPSSPPSSSSSSPPPSMQLHGFTPNQGPVASHDSIIRHLLISCHTSLLSVYALVLDMLERAAAVSEAAGPLGDLRLVTVAQLCSYLLHRKYDSIDLYLASWNNGCSETLVDKSNIYQPRRPSQPPLDSAAQEMHGLRAELEQRLVRLQRRLRLQ
ncbi:hypothetical protein BX600DRAFT_514177 [Xylariales sp. PMI_506]|nr:hypothetical protein BX600DRAFT_514177 [Xylariales sp. PMI_506]